MIRQVLSRAVALGRSRLPALGARLGERLVGPPTPESAFAANTRGLGPDPDMVAWSRASGRPVSIVIPSYNDVELLTECLRSIAETCSGIEHEVIVVDDYCQPENSERLAALQSDTVRVIFKERRQGFAIAVNVGMAAARHDIVLLNSDIVALPGWLEALQYSAYAIDPLIGLVSGKLVYPDGRIQYGGTYYARVLAPQWFGHLYVGSPATRPQANVPGYNRSISGACLYLTREAYETLGGLDEGYWLGFEDVDYGLTAWTEGIRCYYQPAAMLVHHESASRGYSQGPREIASMRYFWRSWQQRFLARRLPERPPVDLVVSDRSPELWRAYVREQADSLRDHGHDVQVHETDSSSVDEALVAALAARDSVKIACDWGSGIVTWLGSVDAGAAAYLLPGVESGAFPDDPALQSRIVADYRPEFDYLAPNRWTADQLRAETAWETRRLVPPALRPVPIDPHADRTRSVASFGLSPDLRARLDGVAMRTGATVQHFDGSEPDAAALDALRAARPRAVVSLAEYDSSLVPASLMSVGAVFVGRHNDKTRYEVLDGYNALLVPPAGAAEMLTAVELALTDDSARAELAANGFETAVRLSETARSELAGAIGSIAQTAV